MSQLPANEIVARSNQKLFSLYENQLKKQTLKDYADTAAKLAAWLSNSKAYYVAARPRIVNLLVTAQITLRKAVEYTTDIQVAFNAAQFLDHPLAAGYVRLVQAVAPFQDLFTEPDLREHMVELLRSVEGVSLPNMSLSLPANSLAKQPPPIASDTSGSRTPTQLPAITSPVIPTNAPSLSPSVKAEGTTAQYLVTVSDSVQGISKDHVRPPVQGINTPSTHQSSAPVDAPKGKVKPKKKKRIDISAFVQTDRQDYERKQAQTQKQVSDTTPHIKIEPEVEQIHSANANGLHVATVPESQPHSIGSQATQNVTTDVRAPFVPTTNADCRQNQHDPSNSNPTSAPPGRTTSPETTSLVVRGLSTLSLLSSVGSKTTNTNEAHETGGILSRRGSNLAKLVDLVLSQNHFTTSETFSAQPQEAQPFVIPEDSELGCLFKWHREYKSAQLPAGEPIQSVELCGQEDRESINTSAGLADDLSALGSLTQVSGRLLKVLALSPGHSLKRSLEFAFETNTSDMGPLSKWVNRSTVRLRELVSCYCLSLGCYSTRELKKAANQLPEGTDDDVIKNIIESLPSIWPQDGGLIMNISLVGSRKDLPLSPPFVVTADGLVDVSEFIVLGKNRLQIHQSGGYADYTFILQVHTPKFKQLQEVVEHRRKEVEWKDWLGEITRPLKIGSPKFTSALK